jgi:uncharacterized protein YndB with AHSA1/START domain
MEPLDLTVQPPRSGREELLEFRFIPRTIDKLRARLPGGNIGKYHVEGVSALLLGELGIEVQEMQASVAAAGCDDDVAAWLRERLDLTRACELNARYCAKGPGNVAPEGVAFFRRDLHWSIRGMAFATFAEALELDDRVEFPEHERADTLRREIVVEAPPARVWSALVDPGEIVRWWGADGVYRMTGVEQALQVGGDARYAGRFAAALEGGRAFCGVGSVRAVEAPRLLVYTRTYDDGIPIAEETAICYQLVQEAGSTRVGVMHWGFADAQGRDLHAAGWDRVLSWLQSYLREAAATAV